MGRDRHKQENGFSWKLIIISFVMIIAFLFSLRSAVKKHEELQADKQNTSEIPRLPLPETKENKSAFAKWEDVGIKTVFLPKRYFDKASDIAELNLLCAEDLPGSENLDIDKCLDILDKWAAWVKKETDRNIYKYHKNPSEFYNSEAYFRMLLLVCTLQEDFKVKYNPKFIDKTAYIPPAQDAKDMFLHGLLSDSRTGTCASMPVLYLTVGRRLGYPLKLVVAKNHIFLRWEDEKEKINLEGTNRGLGLETEDYYRNWMKFTPEENQFSYFFRSLNPMEEYALFLEFRADVMRDNGRFDEAIRIYEKVLDYVPDHPGIKKTVAKVRSQQTGEKMKFKEGKKEDITRERMQSADLAMKAILKITDDFNLKMANIHNKYQQLRLDNPKDNEMLWQKQQKETEKLSFINSMIVFELKNWKNQALTGNGPPITQSQIDMLTGMRNDESEVPFAIREMQRINKENEQRRLQNAPVLHQHTQTVQKSRNRNLSIQENNAYLMEQENIRCQIIRAQNMRLTAEENLRLQQQRYTPQNNVNVKYNNGR